MTALERELADAKGERDARVKEKNDACEDAKVTLLQLHQVQEELERCFLESRALDDILCQYHKQSLAMREVIAKLIACKE